MREKNFNSLAELRAEIAVLKVKNFEQGEVIREAFSKPFTAYQTIKGLFTSGKNKGVLDTVDFMKNDVITGLSRLILPIFMNGLIFKKSNFLVKTLVLFLSQKMAKNIDADKLSDSVGSIKKFIAEKIPDLLKNFSFFSRKKENVDPAVDHEHFV